MIIRVKTLVFCENFMSTETFALCETNTYKERVFVISIALGVIV